VCTSILPIHSIRCDTLSLAFGPPIEPLRLRSSRPQNESIKNVNFIFSQSNFYPADYDHRSRTSPSRVRDDVYLHPNIVSQLAHLTIQLALAFALFPTFIPRPLILTAVYIRPYLPSTLTVALRAPFSPEFASRNHTYHNDTDTLAAKTHPFRLGSLAHRIKPYLKNAAAKETHAFTSVNVALWTSQQ
jgi:hypothetical protein